MKGLTLAAEKWNPMGKTSAKIENKDFLDSDKNMMENASNKMSIAQVYIFRREECLGWDCFYKDTISIGRGTNADIRLSEENIDDIHAQIKIKNGQIIVSPKQADKPIHVNGKMVESCILGQFDFITVGSHRIKVKLPKLSQASLKSSGTEFTDTITPESSEIEDDQTVAQEEEQLVSETEREQNDHFDETEAREIDEVGDDSTYTPNFLLVSDQTEKLDSVDRLEFVDSNEIGADDSKTRNDFPLVVSYHHESDVEKNNTEKNILNEALSIEAPEKIDVENIFDAAHGSIEAQEEEPTEDDTLSVNDIHKFLDQKIENLSHESSTKESARFKIVFQGRCHEDYDESQVKEVLSDILNLNNKKLNQLFSGQRVIVKKEIDYETAQKYQNIFENAGAICKIESTGDPEAVVQKDTHKIQTENIAKTFSALNLKKTDENRAPSFDSDDLKNSDSKFIDQQPVEVYWEDAEEDEDYDDNPTPFLKEVLVDAQSDESPLPQNETSIEIIKLKNSNIIDVRFLNFSEKYFIYNGNGRFCLVEYKNRKRCYIYLDGNLKGHVQSEGAESAGIDVYKTLENIHKKSKGIYRVSLDSECQFSLSDGDYTYLVRKTNRAESPEVVEPEKQKNPLYKNLLRSSGFHLLVMFIFGLAGLFPEMPEPKGPESHFVKIDVSQLKQDPPAVVKPKPKEKPPEVRPAETQLAKVTQPKKKSKPKKQAGRISSSPIAGGGSGKDGNVLNRNVNETGILGMIGDSIGFTPKEALATVTNLDVVASPVSGGRNMKVGGIAGKLSTDEISIPTGGVMRSSSTSQVLRSVGVAGEGTVAALKKGKTGQKNVVGMVSVDLDKSVRVQGGMSREDVKKVIDQHLDEISFCYENALMDSPALMGNIVFEWKILLSGNVGEVRIKSSSIRSKEIHSCIKAAIKTWQFPQPTNAEVVVSYPFVFNIVGF